MDAVFLIGRILFGILFIASGLLVTLGPTNNRAATRRAWGSRWPGPRAGESGIGIIAGGLGVAVGVWADLAALGLAVFLFFTAFLMHEFWRERDPMTRLVELTRFQKGLALLGASLVVFAVNAFEGEFGPAVTGPLFEL